MIAPVVDPAASAHLDRIRVVVVDDDAGWRLIAETALHRFGCDIVGSAADGAEAVAVVRATDPDVVLLDVRMPHVDGLAALERIRELPNTRVVMCSAEDQYRAEALEAGADSWFTKSDGLSSLLAAVTGGADSPT
jgi:two-component system, chemotaxis family, chemotaxis protein CheY